MKDPQFLTIGMHLADALKKTKWYQFRTRRKLNNAICASYLDYQGHHELANKVFNLHDTKSTK